MKRDRNANMNYVGQFRDKKGIRKDPSIGQGINVIRLQSEKAVDDDGIMCTGQAIPKLSRMHEC